MAGLKGGTVEVVPSYDPAWPHKFAAEAEAIRAALGDLAADLQRFGANTTDLSPLRANASVIVGSLWT